MTTGIIDASLIPVRRPHFRVSGNSVHFLISKRPFAQLDEQELSAWNSVDGLASMATLRAGQKDSADRCIARLLDLGMCELVQASFAPGRRRIVVVEAHMDDAILSCGGTMWQRRNECEFIVVTVAGVSNFSSYYFLDRDYFSVEEVTTLRRQETQVVLRMLGARHVALDQTEAPLRYQPGDWTLEWFRRHRKPIGTYLFHHAGAEELRSWTAALAKALPELDAQEVWLPLGVGMHTDHELTRNAGLAVMAASGLAARIPLRLYEDVPYAANAPAEAAAITADLVKAGARLEREEVVISESIEQKRRLVSIFGSQFKNETLWPSIEASSHIGREPNSKRTETFYRVDALPKPERALSAGRTVAVQARNGLAAWLRKHRQAQRLIIVSPSGSGRWADDMQFLLREFPVAQLEVHIDRQYVEEAAAFQSPRLRVQPVDGRYVGWAKRVARVALARGPVVIMLGRGRGKLGRFAPFLLPLADLASAGSMGDFVLAVERSLSEK